MKTYEHPTIEQLESNRAIYVLRDGRGNLVGAGSREVLEVLLKMSKRCARAITDQESALIMTPAKAN